MTEAQRLRLIRGFNIRVKQLSAQGQDLPVKYRLHDGHHFADVQIILAPWLRRMPRKADLS